jgi:hypothetical protein
MAKIRTLVPAFFWSLLLLTPCLAQYPWIPPPPPPAAPPDDAAQCQWVDGATAAWLDCDADAGELADHIASIKEALWVRNHPRCNWATYGATILDIEAGVLLYETRMLLCQAEHEAARARYRLASSTHSDHLEGLHDIRQPFSGSLIGRTCDEPGIPSSLKYCRVANYHWAIAMEMFQTAGSSYRWTTKNWALPSLKSLQDIRTAVEAPPAQ